MDICEFCSLERQTVPVLPDNLQDVPVDGLYQSVFYNGESFYVKPDISPIVENHFLIIPKRHLFCMNDIKSESEDELLYIKKRIVSFYENMGMNYVFFEHGSCGEKESGSSCIHHAHLHSIPLSANLEKNMIEKVVSVLGIPNADSESVKGCAYLYLETTMMSRPQFWLDDVQRHQFFRIIVSEVSGNIQRARWQNCLINEKERATSKMWLNKFEMGTFSLDKTSK